MRTQLSSELINELSPQCLLFVGIMVSEEDNAKRGLITHINLINQ